MLDRVEIINKVQWVVLLLLNEQEHELEKVVDEQGNRYQKLDILLFLGEDI